MHDLSHLFVKHNDNRYCSLNRCRNSYEGNVDILHSTEHEDLQSMKLHKALRKDISSPMEIFMVD